MSSPGSPSGPAEVAFYPFRLDRRARRLYRGDEVVALRPKTFAVLCQLVERAGEVVSRQELLDRVWANVSVTQDMPRLSVGELRRALGDDARAPRYIETVAREGYCFIAPLEQGPAEAEGFPRGGALLGRAAALAEIDAWLDAALAGRRQLGIVSGEVGAGKTTLLDAALERMRSRRARDTGGTLRIGTGQCVEQLGEGEPFMPVLEALGRVERQRAAGRAGRPAESHAGRLRELADRIETLAAEAPLVLALEDLHWSDRSTVALLTLLAQRPGPARLLVLATLRPADALARTAPGPVFHAELLRKGLCHELRLAGLGRREVARLLAARLGGLASPALVEFVFARTEGHPFFLVALYESLLAADLLVETDGGWRLRDEAGAAALTPAGARAAIEARIARLTPEEVRALEAASVVGMEFDSALAAAAFDSEASGEARLEQVEALCDGLARREEFLAAIEGASAGRCDYVFRHALHREVVYERLPPARARRLHRAVGETIESTGAAPRAALLATHFERGGDPERAFRYHREAADAARASFADPEVALHHEASLRALRELPDTPERAQDELETLQQLSSVLLGLRGLADPDVGAVFTRKLALAERLEVPVHAFAAKGELFFHHQTRAELERAAPLALALLETAERHPEFVPFSFVAQTAAGALRCNRGEFEAARAHLARARELFDPAVPMSAPVDLGVVCLRYLADALAVLGEVEPALELGRAALARAGVAGRPADLAFGSLVASELATFLGDPKDALSHAEHTLDVCKEYDLPLFASGAEIIRGWALARLGDAPRGVGVLRRGLERFEGFEQRIGSSQFLAVLADASLCAGDAAGALEAVARGERHVRTTGERRHDAELARLRGEARLGGAGGASANAAAARECFERALRIAREQGARLFELRAATSLARLERDAGAPGPARRALAALCDDFSAGPGCADLVAARALL